MLQMYLVCIGLGGTLLAASLLLGGDTDVGDVQFDVDADVDGEVEIDGDADGSVFDSMLAWFPLASMRFWTFFLAFFGITGALLTAFGGRSIVIGAIAAAVGYVAGTGAVAVFRSLRKGSVDSTASFLDFVGEPAEVVVPIAKDKPGKVRVCTGNQYFEFLAETHDEAQFLINQTVLVYDANDTSVVVTELGGVNG